MMRQSSSRNHRAKGLRMKSVLQICLLAAVCFWLLYQLKHSLDKKRALEERNSRMLNDMDGSPPDLFKLGRKDLPHAEVTVSGHEAITQKEDNNEDVDEEEEDQEARQTNENGKVPGAGDDEIDEQDHESDEEQEDQERGDEDPEIGDDAINEEEKDEQFDVMELLDDQEHDEGSENGPREESYKKYDASGAVHWENQETGSEDKKVGGQEEQAENLEEKVVDMEHLTFAKGDGSKVNNSSVAGAFVGNETTQSTKLMINEVAIEKRGLEFGSINSVVTINDSQAEIQTNSTVLSASDAEEKLQINSVADITTNQAKTQMSNSSIVNGAANTVPNQNETLINGSIEYKKFISEIGTIEENRPHLNTVLELAEKSNITAGHDNFGEHSTASLAMNENGETAEGESARSSHRMVTEEEKEARVDLSTLPDIKNGVKRIEDESAE